MSASLMSAYQGPRTGAKFATGATVVAVSMRPPPIRTNGSRAVARLRMQVRVPRIAREVVDRNRNFAAEVQRAVEKLAVDIETDRPLAAPRPPGIDIAGWEAAYAERAGESWLGTEWFHAEFAFYRELARCCRFWETGRDPFEPAKEEELADARPWQHLAAAIASSKEGTGGAREA